jgi:hypothetical protein
MKPWGWLLIGLAAGALALFVYQKRKAISFAAAHKDQLAAGGQVLGGLSDAWEGVEQLLGRK